MPLLVKVKQRGFAMCSQRKVFAQVKLLLAQHKVCVSLCGCVCMAACVCNCVQDMYVNQGVLFGLFSGLLSPHIAILTPSTPQRTATLPF